MTHTDPKCPRETEIRFSLPAEARSRMDAYTAFHPTRATAPETLHQVTTYFDTPDFALAQCGVSLRIRCTGDTRIQTVKWQLGNERSPFSRGEQEWPVDSDEPDLLLLANTPAGTVLEREGPVGLRPAFRTDVQRTRRYLLPAAGTVIEAALDEGTISAGQVHEEFQELELELKVGQAEQLFRLAVGLNDTVPLALSLESKSARGYRLATCGSPGARKAEPLNLPRSVSVAKGFRQIIGSALTQLLANQPAAAAGGVEGVHQMRIAVRRLRSAIGLFQRYLEPQAAARFDAGLKRVGRVLGEVRDWDVFCGNILSAAENDAPQARPHLLRGPATAQRAEAYRWLVDELEGPAFTALVLGLMAWVEDRSESMPLLGIGHSGDRLTDLAPKMLDRAARKARRRGRHLRHRSSEELHDLRKSLKKLRYSVEFLSDLFGRKRTHAYLQACKDLQEQLGAINDAALAAALTSRLAGVAARITLVPTFSMMSEWSKAQETTHLRRLPDAWGKFKVLPSLVH